MASTSLIESIVESIKGYFSITGVIVIGVYMVHNAGAAGSGFKSIDYVSGFLAIIMGSLVGLWYSAHIFRKLLEMRSTGAVNLVQGIVYGVFVLLAFLMITSIILGSVTSSCGAVFSR